MKNGEEKVLFVHGLHTHTYNVYVCEIKARVILLVEEEKKKYLKDLTSTHIILFSFGSSCTLIISIRFYINIYLEIWVATQQ